MTDSHKSYSEHQSDQVYMAYTKTPKGKQKGEGKKRKKSSLSYLELRQSIKPTMDVKKFPYALLTHSKKLYRGQFDCLISLSNIFK